MREILFRGKRKDFDNEWLYGFYTLYNDNRGMKSAIITGTDKHCFIPLEVIPETVSQYTGLTDKNGTKIFEGDIVKHYTKTHIGDPDYYIVVLIEWNKKNFRYQQRRENGGYYFVSDSCVFEVIGNIHDNPELLNGDTDVLS